MSRRPESMFQPLDWFMLRTPALPVATWTSLGDDLKAATAGTESHDLAECLAEDRRLTDARLRHRFAETFPRKALFFTSADLAETLDLWLADRPSGRTDGLDAKLLQYLGRMSLRATPFGLFGGYSIGTVGTECRLEIPSAELCAIDSAPDFSILTDLADTLRAQADITANAYYHANPTVYRAEGRLRYYERVREQSAWRHQLAALDANEAVMLVLDRARSGGTLAELAAALSAVDPSISETEARQFVMRLIDAGLLLDRLDPPLLADDPTGAFAAQLDALETRPAKAAAAGIRTLADGLARLDKNPASGPADYRAVAEQFALPASQPFRPAPFHAVLRKPAESLQLDAALAKRIARGAELLLTATPPSPDPWLDDFITRFGERYEGGEVFLLEALDEEIGIGFGPPSLPDEADSPWFAGLTFAADGERSARWTERDECLLQHLLPVWRDGRQVLRLNEDELAALGARTAAIPGDGLSVTATLISAEADAGKIWIQSLMPPSPVSLMTRFCAGDAALTARVKASAAAPTGTVAIAAEVAHLPQPRAGNVLQRPALQGPVIELFGHGDGSDSIPLGDLTLQRVDDRLALRSHSRGLEILPRISSAHDAAFTDLPAYRLLAALQYQNGLRPTAWNWGVFGRCPFLPRVEVGRYILSPATWTITGEPLAALTAALSAPTERRDAAVFRAIAALRERLGLPRRVGWAESDMVLPVDLDNALGLAALIRRAQTLGHLRLIELLMAEASPVTDPTGARYAHEIILPLRPQRVASAMRKPSMRTSSGKSAAADTIERRFPPGSPWLSIKLYGSLRTLESVLTDELARQLVEWERQAVIDRWFFLRYQDPAPHLRLRLQADPDRVDAALMPALNGRLRELAAAYGLDRYEYDTYTREIERYGGPAAIEPMEGFFAADSRWAIAVIGQTESDTDERERWLVTSIDALLNAFALPATVRSQLLASAADGLRREFELLPEFSRSIGALHRRLQTSLDRWLSDPIGFQHDRLAPSLQNYKDEAATLYRHLHRLDGGLGRPLEAILQDLIHLSVNRIARARPRLLELVLLELLARHYRGQAARHVAA